jgi:hypothetical protein
MFSNGVKRISLDLFLVIFLLIEIGNIQCTIKTFQKEIKREKEVLIEKLNIISLKTLPDFGGCIL